MALAALVNVTLDLGTQWRYAVARINDPCSLKVQKRQWSLQYNAFRAQDSAVVCGKEILGLGTDAEHIYATRNKEKDGFILFRNLNMILRRENLALDSCVESSDGTQVTAAHLFGMILKYMSDDFMQQYSVRNDEIQWSLIVPARCYDGTKLFFEHVAEKIGLTGGTSSKLVFLCEPESAAAYLKRHDSSYVLVHMECTAVDIAFIDCATKKTTTYVHEVDWREETVWGVFEQQLRMQLGHSVIDGMDRDHSDKWLEMKQQFGQRLRSHGMERKFSMNVSPELAKMFLRNTGRPIDKEFDKTWDPVYFSNGMIVYKSEVINHLFDITLNKVCKFLDDLLENTWKEIIGNSPQEVIFVGSLCEIQYIRTVLSRYYSIKVNVTFADNCTLAVTRGSFSLVSDKREQQNGNNSTTIPDQEIKCISPFASKGLVVVAIDFGTSQSGYAYSFMDEPDNIRMKTWQSHATSHYKTATSVLVDNSGHFEDFGFSAEAKFKDKAYSGRYHLFQQFKMVLHRIEDIGTELHSVEGIFTMDASDVFRMCLQYLKEDVHTTLVGRVRPEEIQWVITVPAIWSDRAKRFMREAACKAGLIQNVDSQQLLIALEPEAAALFCHYIDMGSLEGDVESDELLPPGCKYMIVDIGGGTVDIAVHQVGFDKKVRELMYPRGSNLGGYEVNRAFEELMGNLLGDDVLRCMKIDFEREWWMFMMQFENKKRSFDGKGSLNMQFINVLADAYRKTTYRNIETVFAAPEKCVELKSGVLKFDSKLIQKLFDVTIDKISVLLERLLDNTEFRDISKMILVGGFSESVYVQDKLRAKFERLVNVHVPLGASFAVMKGAVLFGHDPSKIQSRIAKRSYGIETHVPFDSMVHPVERRWTSADGKHFCTGVFATIIGKGTPLDMNESKTFSFGPLQSGQSSVEFCFYAVDQFIDTGNPIYISSTLGFEKIHSASIPLSYCEKGVSQTIELSVSFGTEAKVMLWDITPGKHCEPLGSHFIFSTDLRHPPGDAQPSFQERQRVPEIPMREPRQRVPKISMSEVQYDLTTRMNQHTVASGRNESEAAKTIENAHLIPAPVNRIRRRTPRHNFMYSQIRGMESQRERNTTCQAHNVSEPASSLDDKVVHVQELQARMEHVRIMNKTDADKHMENTCSALEPTGQIPNLTDLQVREMTIQRERNPTHQVHNVSEPESNLDHIEVDIEEQPDHMKHTETKKKNKKRKKRRCTIM